MSLAIGLVGRSPWTAADALVRPPAGRVTQPQLLPGLRFAFLWVARDDLARYAGHAFNGQFLGIADPWTDERLRRWNGCAATWYFDPEGMRAAASTPGARPREMIPLAIYSLEYPRVPLLLVDFRDARAPRRREMARRSIRDVLTGIVGFSPFAHWYYFAGHSAFFFVAGRRGGAVDRDSRQNAYALFRTFLWLDDSLDPRLRGELRRRERLLALNPLEGGEADEALVARRNYDALAGWLRAPAGAKHVLDKRRAELTGYVHSQDQAGAVPGRIPPPGVRRAVSSAPAKRPIPKRNA